VLTKQLFPAQKFSQRGGIKGHDLRRLALDET